MRGRILCTLGVLALAVLGFGSGQPPLLREVQQHLDLARRCANAGEVNRALAHAAVVVPEKALRVKIDCSNVDRSSQGLYRNALNGAFRMWEEALGQKVF